MEEVVEVHNCSNCCLSTLLTLTPIDINECAVNNGNCGTDKSCTNTIGSYSCQCKAGYRQLTNGNCEGIEHRNVIVLLHIYQTPFYYQILMSAPLQTFVAQTNSVPILQVHIYVPVILVTGRVEMDIVKVSRNTRV